MTDPRRPQNRKDPVVPRRPRLALASLAVVCGVALTGCGSSADTSATEVGHAAPRTAAATIGDRTITIGDVQAATAGANDFVREQGGQQQLGARDVLTTLIYAPEIMTTARESGVSVPSAAAVERVLGQIGVEQAPATVEFIRAQAVREQMTQEQLAAAVSSADGHVSLNPRYGTFDIQQGIVDSQPNWLAEKSANPDNPLGDSLGGPVEGEIPEPGHEGHDH
jgi:hypothetical protein